MKIIDQTPFLDSSGQFSLVNRIQAMLKYGLSWPANLEAQRKVIVQLNRAIEKGYTLFRNQKLGTSEIIIPLIIVGSSGIYVLEATPLKGFYRARGDEWGTVVNGRFQPADINILSRTARMAKVLQVFFERQGTNLAAPIEPVLLAADPGMHIESARPAVRVVMSDAIDRFAASLLTGRVVYNAATVNELVERILNPRSIRQQNQPLPEPVDDAFKVKDETPFPATESSRMQAIMNAPHNDALIESGQSEVAFAFDGDPSGQPTVLVSNPRSERAGEYPQTIKPAQKRILGMLPWQAGCLALVFACWCVFMAVSVYLIYTSSQSLP
jgi:hypothetical protein